MAKLIRSLFDFSRTGSSQQNSLDIRVPRGDEIQQLHAPKSVEGLKRFLVENTSLDLNAIEPTLSKAPIHSILIGNPQVRNWLLEVLLTYGNIDVNLPDLDGMSPLHLAVKNNDIPSIKLLTAFGASLNIVNRVNQTPLALSKSKTTRYFLRKMDSWTGVSFEDADTLGFTFVPNPSSPVAVGSDLIDSATHDKKADTSLEKTYQLASNNEELSLSLSRKEVESEQVLLLRSVGGSMAQDAIQSNRPSLFQEKVPYEDHFPERKLYLQLHDTLRKQMNDFDSISSPDEILACHKQRKELAKFKKTGNRILCLDGGGMKALVELDILSNIEKHTGRKITEIFDWIVGTSTGGIIALGLVYAKKSVEELRQLCWQLKDVVFANPKFGITYNSEALEKLLKETVGTTMRMSDITHPKVLVSAVYKGSTPLQIHFFNNCFQNELSNELVWKVARSTCAGPMLFSEFNNYVDGGVLCNNPTDQGVTAIQNYHWEKGEKLPISLVVSVGSGMYPKEKLGNVDAQDCISVGKMSCLKDRVSNLLDLFMNALVESESVAETCQRNFKEQGIPYYRFSPQLTETISSGETNSRKLTDMVITTRQQTIEAIKDMTAEKFF